MPDPTTPAGRLDFQQQLREIWEDPQIRRLARRRAGNPDIAEDALQETYYAVARVADPSRIEDLRKYFCRALIHEVYRLLGQLGAVLVDDFAALAEARQAKAREQLPAPVEEVACADLQARTWLERFAAQREILIGKVPGRSPDPARYRAVIVAAAGQLLISMARRDVSDADFCESLRAAYPEWFAEPGCGTANAHQRFTRARADVRSVLQRIMARDELSP